MQHALCRMSVYSRRQGLIFVFIQNSGFTNSLHSFLPKRKIGFIQNYEDYNYEDYVEITLIPIFP